MSPNLRLSDVFSGLDWGYAFLGRLPPRGCALLLYQVTHHINMIRHINLNYLVKVVSDRFLHEIVRIFPFQPALESGLLTPVHTQGRGKKLHLESVVILKPLHVLVNLERDPLRLHTWLFLLRVLATNFSFHWWMRLLFWCSFCSSRGKQIIRNKYLYIFIHVRMIISENERVPDIYLRHIHLKCREWPRMQTLD